MVGKISNLGILNNSKKTKNNRKNKNSQIVTTPENKKSTAKKKLAVGIGAATALGAVITAGIMLSKGKGLYKIVKSINESGQEIIEKLQKEGNEIVERKTFQKGSKKLESLEEFYNGVMYKKSFFYEDGTTLKSEKIFANSFSELNEEITRNFAKDGKTLTSSISKDKANQIVHKTTYHPNGVKATDSLSMKNMSDYSVTYDENGSEIARTLAVENGKILTTTSR